MKKTLVALLGVFILAACGTTSMPPKKIVCAYVAQGVPEDLSAEYVNRIIYSYAELDSSLAAIRVLDPSRLEKVVALRENKPELEVLVSIGGSSSDMSLALRSDSLRALVVASCKSIVENMSLDGIDVDWEFPGRGEHALSTEEDVANYVKFLADLRRELGDDRIITIACSGSSYGVDFDGMTPYVDQFNLMTYDMGTAPSHHSALYDSEHVSWLSCHRSVSNYLEGGVPASKIVLGLPFYGRGRDAFKDFTDWRHIRMSEGLTERYDSVAQVPWIADSAGTLVLSYDNPKSLRVKCDYALEKDLAGVMYWRMELDDSVRTLGRAVAEAMR